MSRDITSLHEFVLCNHVTDDMLPIMDIVSQDMSRTLQYSNHDVITPLNGTEKKSRSINKMLFVEDLDILVSDETL